MSKRWIDLLWDRLSSACHLRDSQVQRLPMQSRTAIIRGVNGVHDMGGMDGFDPIPIEENEPVFHAEWEGRICAIFVSLLPRLRGVRHAIERILAPVYLASSYYERWLNAMVELLVERGQLTREELTSRGIDSVTLIPPTPNFEAGSGIRRRSIRSSRCTKRGWGRAMAHAS
jgi:hypothetical protein